jgi:hypothetical protein
LVRAALFATRVLLPLALGATGLVLAILGTDATEAAGITLIGCALLVVLANAFVRLSVHEEDDRAREQAARDYYGRHGRWPDEDA